MEIIISEHDKAEKHKAITPTLLARKLELSHSVVTKALISHQTPMETVVFSPRRSERHIKPENALSLIEHITLMHTGAYPDIEQHLLSEEGVTIEVNPEQRPQNRTRAKRGKIYPQRRFLFRG